MVENRLIPILLMADGRLVKTVRFDSRTYVGDPINAIRIFNDKEVDEIIVLDIEAASRGGPDLDMLEKLAAEAFMPMAYGGGIIDVQEASRVLSIGVEKVSVGRRFIEDPTVVRSLADEFGSQSVIVSLDVHTNPAGDFLRLASGSSARVALGSVLRLASESGAGEILLQSVDRDGTMSGMEHDLIERAARQCSVPLIAAGGLSSLADASRSIGSGADAVAGGAFFVFRGRRRAVLITYPTRTEILGAMGSTP